MWLSKFGCHGTFGQWNNKTTMFISSDKHWNDQEQNIPPKLEATVFPYASQNLQRSSVRTDMKWVVTMFNPVWGPALPANIHPNSVFNSDFWHPHCRPWHISSMNVPTMSIPRLVISRVCELQTIQVAPALRVIRCMGRSPVIRGKMNAFATCLPPSVLAEEMETMGQTSYTTNLCILSVPLQV